MLWLLFSCGEQETLEPPPSETEEKPVVLGKEVQALWTPIEASKSKLSRHRFLAWDRNQNGTVDDNTELISFFDTDGMQTFSDGFAMLAHYFDSDRNGTLEGKELSELAIWTDIHTPSLFNQLAQEDTSELVTLQSLGVTQIDLQNTASNTWLEQTELCILTSTTQEETPLWIPPAAGPIAEDCDLRSLRCVSFARTLGRLLCSLRLSSMVAFNPVYLFRCGAVASKQLSVQLCHIFIACV